MCGIVGIVGGHPSERARARCLGELSHRGPDARGEVALKVAGTPVWLGHTRLAILDLSEAGAQPMASRDGRWQVVFNGEIYGHQALRDDLEGPFRGHSDTETLVEALAAWGIEHTLERLDGMFAFAALDTVDGVLHLVRDPFGIKPVYWARRGQRLAFASEAGALFGALGERPGLSEVGLRTFLTLRFVPSPDTLWSGVHRLPAGHRLEVPLADGRARTLRWIRPTRDRFTGSLDDAVEAYRAVLGAAVARQMLSDVPVGVLLSGGVDSALIAGLAREHGDGGLPAFTVGYEGAHAECEIDAAAETARILGLRHQAVRVGPDALWGALDEAVRAVEEPLGTTSILPMVHLVRRARQEVTVVLTGQGSDEPLGGYRRYQGELLREKLPWPGGLRLLSPLRRAPVPDFVERGLRSLPLADAADRFVASYALFTGDERRQLTGSAGSGHARQAVQGWLQWQDDPDLRPAERMMRVDTRMQLADDLLLYGDKVSMAVSLEARVPMLDQAVVAFVESLPLRYRVRLFRTKIVHKRMARDYLPARIVHRPKQNFGVPFAALARGGWRGRVEDALVAPGAPHLDVLERAGIEPLWRQHLRGRDRTRQLFALLTFAAWCRHHLAGASS